MEFNENRTVQWNKTFSTKCAQQSGNFIPYDVIIISQLNDKNLMRCHIMFFLIRIYDTSLEITGRL